MVRLIKVYKPKAPSLKRGGPSIQRTTWSPFQKGADVDIMVPLDGHGSESVFVALL